MASSKPKLMQQCKSCSFRVRRVWPTDLRCHCGGEFLLAPRQGILTPQQRWEIGVLAWCGSTGMQRGNWSHAAIARLYDVTPKTVSNCLERLVRS